MDHALLVSFLAGQTSPEEFGRLIEKEVVDCERGCSSPAGIGYIVITDGPLITVTREQMKRLLRCIADESLPWMSANYTGDCLMMSGDFQPEDDAVAEAIEFVADDSRPPTADEIMAAMTALG